jgi:hypothetical protein
MASLRYFYEEIPELHIIAAGSLLNFEFRQIPFPVGRIELMQLHPLSFLEFLMARGKNKLVKVLTQPIEQFQESYWPYFEEELNLYTIIGGMPEVVSEFIQKSNMEVIREIQNNLMYSYEQDFKKYKPQVNSDCLNDILQSIPRLISNQIIYTKLSKRYTGATIKTGLEVLKTARLLYTLHNVSIAGLPLTKSGKQFKAYYLDIGLLVRKSGVDLKTLNYLSKLTTTIQGMLAEQFVAQQLIAHSDSVPNYWARTERGASSEIDFVIEQDDKIIPIEVKAGSSGSLKSLQYLLAHYPDIEKAIVYSNSRAGIEGKIHFIPLIYAGLLTTEE